MQTPRRRFGSYKHTCSLCVGSLDYSAGIPPLLFSLFCAGFVDPSAVHFSYRYGLCPAQATSCAPQGALTPSSVESSPRSARYLRHRTPQGSSGFVLFAGEGEAELVEKVKAVVAEQLGADISKITPQSHFIKVRLWSNTASHPWLLVTVFPI